LISSASYGPDRWLHQCVIQHVVGAEGLDSGPGQVNGKGETGRSAAAILRYATDYYLN